MKPPYARMAFLNPYNLSLLVGGVVLGLAIDEPWLSILTCAAEALWMIFAPDSKLLRAVWFDRTLGAEERASLAERRRERCAHLSPNANARLGWLCGQKQVIEHLAKENPSLTVDLLKDELGKLDALLDDFIELGVSEARAERHAGTFDFSEMNRSWAHYQAARDGHPAGDPRRAVAAKNLEVLTQRRARYDDLVRTMQVARGQMDLIEQTFGLLGDEIMTMASTHELGGRIDELRLAVDAVRETTDERFLEVDDLEAVEMTEPRLGRQRS